MVTAILCASFSSLDGINLTLKFPQEYLFKNKNIFCEIVILNEIIFGFITRKKFAYHAVLIARKNINYEAVEFCLGFLGQKRFVTGDGSRWKFAHFLTGFY